MSTESTLEEIKNFDIDNVDLDVSGLSPEERSKASDEHKEKGNTAFKDGKFRDALYYYTIAIVHEPSRAPLYSNRAAAHLKLEEYGSALSDADKAIEVDPTFIKGYYRRGAANMALSRPRDAMEDFRKVLKLKPRDPETLKKFEIAKKAWMENEFALAIQTDDKKPSESIDFEMLANSIPHSYSGPQIDLTLPADKRYTPDLVQEFMQFFEEEKTRSLPRVYLYAILCDAIAMLGKLKSLVDVDVEDKITVCGDTHGQYYDVLNIFKINGLPSESNPYLFNGDYVDRGPFSVEVVLTLLLWKLALPRHMHLTRGNHESIGMNVMYGFKGEVLYKADQKAFDLFTECFNALPLAYVLGKKVLVLHGGLFEDDDVTLDTIRKLDRFRQPPEKGVMCDALWSDPGMRQGRMPPHRGCGVLFGPDITKDFLERNGLSMVVRSHEMKQEGYSVQHDGKCVTIFSAPNYCDSMGNKGAFLRFNKNMEYTPVQFDAVPHPPVSSMHYANPMLRGGM